MQQRGLTQTGFAKNNRQRLMFDPAEQLAQFLVPAKEISLG